MLLKNRRTVRTIYFLMLFSLFITSVSASSEIVTDDGGANFLQKFFSIFGTASLSGDCTLYKTTTDYMKSGEVWVTYTLDDEYVEHEIYQSTTTAFGDQSYSTCVLRDYAFYSGVTILPSSSHTVNVDSAIQYCYKLVRKYYSCESEDSHKTESFYCDSYPDYHWTYGNRYSEGESDSLGQYCSDSDDNSYRDYLGDFHCASFPATAWCEDVTQNRDSTACYEEGGRVLASCDIDDYTDELWKIEEGSSKGMYCCTSGLADIGWLEGLDRWKDGVLRDVGEGVGTVLKPVGEAVGSAVGSLGAGLIEGLDLAWYVWLIIGLIVIFVILRFIGFI